MNRAQRRAQGRPISEGKLTIMDLRQAKTPSQLSTADCCMILIERFKLNIKETGHPYHHRTASGVVVDADPAIEFYLARMKKDEKFRTLAEDTELVNAEYLKGVDPGKILPAQKINRNYYGGQNPYQLV